MIMTIDDAIRKLREIGEQYGYELPIVTYSGLPIVAIMEPIVAIMVAPNDQQVLFKDECDD